MADEEVLVRLHPDRLQVAVVYVDAVALQADRRWKGQVRPKLQQDLSSQASCVVERLLYTPRARAGIEAIEMESVAVMG